MRRFVLGWKKLGLEQSLGTRLVTYADDLVILCRRGSAETALHYLREIMGKSKGQERSITLQFPEWCRVTITRELNGKERSFVGPKVYWLEAYAKRADTEVPNEMWANRPVGQLEKCAEAGALRRAFPEEIGNEVSPPRKWKVGTPSMPRPTFRKSRSRRASRPRVPEGSANLSRRSCRNHSP